MAGSLPLSVHFSSQLTEIMTTQKPDIKWKVVNTFNGRVEAINLTHAEAFRLHERTRLSAPVPEDWDWIFNHGSNKWEWIDLSN